MALNPVRFAAELRRFTVIGLDSVVLIYHLDDIEPYSQLTEAVFETIAAGRPRAVLSTVSVTELLVKPFAEDERGQVAAFERFVLSLPNAVLLAPDYPIAREAARLRARYGIKTPDALLVATAKSGRAQALVTNDAGLRPLKAEGLTIVLLENYV